MDNCSKDSAVLITLGTLDWKFERMLKMAEELVRERKIGGNISVQTGFTDYQSDLFKTYKYLRKEEYGEILRNASVIITHGGAGNLFEGIRLGKKIIAVARLVEKEEHIDNHQTELVGKLAREGYILAAENSLIEAWDQLDTFVPRRYDFSNTITQAIKDYIK